MSIKPKRKDAWLGYVITMQQPRIDQFSGPSEQEPSCVSWLRSLSKEGVTNSDERSCSDEGGGGNGALDEGR